MRLTTQQRHSGPRMELVLVSSKSCTTQIAALEPPGMVPVCIEDILRSQKCRQRCSVFDSPRFPGTTAPGRSKVKKSVTCAAGIPALSAQYLAWFAIRRGFSHLDDCEAGAASPSHIGLIPMSPVQSMHTSHSSFVTFTTAALEAADLGFMGE